MNKENTVQIIATTMEQEGLLFGSTRESMVSTLRSYSIGQLEKISDQLSEIPTIGEARRDK